MIRVIKWPEMFEYQMRNLCIKAWERDELQGGGRRGLIRQRSSKGVGIVSHQPFICICPWSNKGWKVKPYIDISSLQPVCSGDLRRSLLSQRIFILRPHSKTMSYRCVECIICASIKQIEFWYFLCFQDSVPSLLVNSTNCMKVSSHSFSIFKYKSAHLFWQVTCFYPHFIPLHIYLCCTI